MPLDAPEADEPDGGIVVTFASPVVVVVVDRLLSDEPERAEPEVVPDSPEDPLPLADGDCDVVPDIPDAPDCEPLWPLALPLADGIWVVVVVPVLVPVEVPAPELPLCCAIADADMPKTSAAALTLLINKLFFINEISWKGGNRPRQTPAPTGCSAAKVLDRTPRRRSPWIAVSHVDNSPKMAYKHLRLSRALLSLRTAFAACQWGPKVDKCGQMRTRGEKQRKLFAACPAGCRNPIGLMPRRLASSEDLMRRT
jgi:hypothetical protein